MFALLLGLIFLPSELVHTLGQTCADTPGLVPLWRAYNGTVVDHFYTTNVTEMESALTQDGYSLEGASSLLWTTQQPGTTPLYRLYNQNAHDHFYTMSQDEIPEMLNAGWGNDTTPIAGYVYPLSMCGASPLYRLFNPTKVDHFYTMDIAEAEVATGYENQGIAGYVALPSIDGSVASSPTPYLLPATAPGSPESEATAATTSSCAISTNAISFLRAYSGFGTDHFYTTNATEMNDALDAYNFEGDATFLWATQETNTVPLYRMFNQDLADHLYTIDANELNEALGLGYVFDTTSHIAGYVYPYSICGSSPIYRLYSSSFSDHFYTMSYNESLGVSGYVIEGIAGFALLPSVNGETQTATVSASPFFLPVSIVPSVTSVSLTLESALVTGTETFASVPITSRAGGTSLAATATNTKSNAAIIAQSVYGFICVAVLIGGWTSL